MVNSEAQVLVRFTSTQQKISSRLPTSAIQVPQKLRRYGLSEVVNLLCETSRPFDFIISGQLLTTSLARYIESTKISTESVIEIHVVESLSPPQEQATIQQDDWISSLKTGGIGLILTGSTDGIARVWNSSGECVNVFKRHEGGICDVAWISDTIAVSASKDGKISAWEFDLNTKNQNVLYDGLYHTGSVECISVSLDTKMLATGSFDNNIALWNSDASLDIVNDTSVSGAQSTKKRKVQEKTPEKVFLIAHSKASISVLHGHNGPVSSVAFASASRLFSAGWDHTVREWDITQAANTNTMNCENVILDMSIHCNEGGLIATGHCDNVVRLWDQRVNSGLVVKLKLASHTNWSSCIAWSSNPYNLASGGYDGDVKIWDIRSNNVPLYSVAGAESGKKIFCIDWAGEYLYSGGEDCKIRIHKV